MDPLLSHEAQEAVLSFIHQVFPTANVKFPCSIRGLPSSIIKNSIHPSPFPPPLVPTVRGTAQEDRGGDPGRGSALKWTSTSSCSYFSSLSVTSPTFSSIASFSIDTVKSSSTPTEFSFVFPPLPQDEIKGDGDKRWVGYSKRPHVAPHCTPSLVSIWGWPRLLPLLYGLSATSLSSSPCFPLCGTSEVVHFPLHSLKSTLPVKASAFSTEVMGPRLLSTASARASLIPSQQFLNDPLSGFDFPRLPFFPHVVVRISGYERVDMSKVIVPRLREVTPAVSITRTKTKRKRSCSRNHHAAEGTEFLSSSSVSHGNRSLSGEVDRSHSERLSHASTEEVPSLPSSLPLAKISAISRVGKKKPPQASSLPSLGLPLIPNFTARKAVMGKDGTPSSATVPSISVWSCRRPPKYVRLQAELQDSPPLYPASRVSRHPRVTPSTSSVTSAVWKENERAPQARRRGEAEIKEEQEIGGRKGVKSKKKKIPTAALLHSSSETLQDTQSISKHDSSPTSRRSALFLKEEAEKAGAGHSAGECSHRMNGYRCSTSCIPGRKDKKWSGSFSSCMQHRKECIFRIQHAVSSVWYWWSWMFTINHPRHAFLVDATEKEKGRKEEKKAALISLEEKARGSFLSTGFVDGGATSFSRSSSATGVVHIGGDLVALSFPSSFVSSRLGGEPREGSTLAKRRMETATMKSLLLSRRLPTRMDALNTCAANTRWEASPWMGSRPVLPSSSVAGPFRKITKEDRRSSTTCMDGRSSFPPSLDFMAREKDRDRPLYYPLLLSFGDTEATLPQLLRTSSASKREKLRGAFGFSLPLLLAALPSICLDVVQRIQHWEVWHSSPLPTMSTSSFSSPLSDKETSSATKRKRCSSSTTFLLSCLFHFLSLLEDRQATHSTTLLPSSGSLSPSQSMSHAKYVLSLDRLMEDVIQAVNDTTPNDVRSGHSFPSTPSAAAAFALAGERRGEDVRHRVRGSAHGPRCGSPLHEAAAWLRVHTNDDTQRGTPPFDSTMRTDKLQGMTTCIANDLPASLYTSISTLLALGTVKMLFETSVPVDEESLSAYSQATRPPFLSTGTSLRHSRKWISSSSSDSCTCTPADSSSPMEPFLPLPFPSRPPPWRINFFLPSEDFDTAEEYHIWVLRSGGGKVDAQQALSAPSFSRACKGGSRVGRNEVEWISCVKCLLEMLVAS